ncbi:MAG TPA: RHS repeat-associated core domain-containing protein [Candidatus Limnocylindrales bacterium]|jgi:RHS repeat-associated protein|nr:RHS repeat-associated core domain-containing protein [Candidatus Limnocylindrales bacterium]
MPESALWFTVVVVWVSVFSSLGAHLSTATVYVGPHFEVRDHDQPTKYVFNGAIRVASVIGSLSPVNRLQRIRTATGWNLCSVAVSGSLAAPTGQNVADIIAGLFKWNTANAEWSAAAVSESLTPGSVIWIRAKTNCTLTVLGPYADPVAQTLSTGGTFVPAAGLEAWSPIFPQGLFASTYQAQTGQWHEEFGDGLAWMSDWPNTVSPGQAFYAEAGTATRLDVPSSALRIRYYHQDHLGSSSLITDTTGAIVEEATFYPFGASHWTAGPDQIRDPYQFTQKERDTEDGLQYFETRYLHNHFGRFLSPDSKYQNPDLLAPEELASYIFQPQKENPYSYVCNNPVGHVDPSGHDISTPLVGRKVQRLRNGGVVVTVHQKNPVTVIRGFATFSFKSPIGFHGIPGLSDTHVEDRGKDVKVTILPNRWNTPTKSGDAETGVEIVPHLSTQAGKTTASYSLTIQSTYPPGYSASDTQAYGRGTTEQDIKNRNTTVTFHEGNHGAAFLNYIENHPLPEFNPSNRPFSKDFNAADASADFDRRVSEYNDAIGEFSKQQVDCVGHVPWFCK